MVAALLVLMALQKKNAVDMSPEARFAPLLLVMAFVLMSGAIASQLAYSDEWQGSWIFAGARPAAGAHPAGCQESDAGRALPAVVLHQFRAPDFPLGSDAGPDSEPLCPRAGVVQLPTGPARLSRFPFSRKLEKGTRIGNWWA